MERLRWTAVAVGEGWGWGGRRALWFGGCLHVIARADGPDGRLPRRAGGGRGRSPPPTPRAGRTPAAQGAAVVDGGHPRLGP
ncbi:hypothetical protein, partial [Actinokineospora sp. NPDC004072]